MNNEKALHNHRYQPSKSYFLINTIHIYLYLYVDLFTYFCLQNKAPRGIAMLRVDKFLYPRQQTRGN